MNKYEAKGISAMKLSWQSRQPTQATALQHLTLGYKKIKLKFLSAISGKSFEEILITHSQVELWPQEMEDHLRTVGEAEPQTHSLPTEHNTEEWVTTSRGCPLLTTARTHLY